VSQDIRWDTTITRLLFVALTCAHLVTVLVLLHSQQSKNELHEVRNVELSIVATIKRSFVQETIGVQPTT